MVASAKYIDNIIDTYEKAAEANLDTVGRAGNVVELDPETAEDVMITGDLHGHRRNFNLIQKTADLDQNPRRHLVLQEVCHGGPTYPKNGGCMSHAVLEDVAQLKVKYPQQVHFILGNHELAELADYPIQKNKQMLNLLFRLGLQQMYGSAIDRVRDAFSLFLQTCPLAVRLSHGVFISHSLPEKVDLNGFDDSIFSRRLKKEDFLEHTGVFDLVWGRDYRPNNAKAFAEAVDARILITGHEPCPNGHRAPNPQQIIVDCCGPKAAYMILPIDGQMSHAEVVERIEKLDS